MFESGQPDSALGQECDLRRRIAELEKENKQLRELGDELAAILRQIFSGEVTEEDAHIVEGEGLAAIKAWEDAREL